LVLEIFTSLSLKNGFPAVQMEATNSIETFAPVNQIQINLIASEV
jgi:hypothetical protein